MSERQLVRLDRWLMMRSGWLAGMDVVIHIARMRSRETLQRLLNGRGVGWRRLELPCCVPGSISAN